VEDELAVFSPLLAPTWEVQQILRPSPGQCFMWEFQEGLDGRPRNRDPICGRNLAHGERGVARKLSTSLRIRSSGQST
jgi:hypothetical protein